MVVDLLMKLIDRVIQLSEHRKKLRRELLVDHVDPVFAAFDDVHDRYLQSFAKYRELLKSSTEPFGSTHPIVDVIRTDNLFSDHERSRIVGLGQAIEHPELQPFIKAIREYLVDTRIADEPPDGYRSSKFRNPQLWRRTLLQELEAIFEGRWQIVLDPCCSGAPLYGDELEDALAGRRREAGIGEEDPRKTDRLKAYFAIAALDELVGEMQEAYARVAAEHAALKMKLTRA